MEQSENINELMSAIASMHDKYGVAITKNAKILNRSTYADLLDIIDTIHDRGKEFGLTMIQPLVEGEYVITEIHHKVSGQWRMFRNKAIRKATEPLCPASPSPEVYKMYLDAIAKYNAMTEAGGATTYCRRYSAMGAFGLFGTDDPTDHDGSPNEKVKKWGPTVEKNRVEAMEDTYVPGKASAPPYRKVSEEQVRLLGYRIKESSRPDARNWILKTYNIEKIEDIPHSKCNEVLDGLKNVS